MQAALELVAERGAERLLVADAVDQIKAEAHTLRGQVDRVSATIRLPAPRQIGTAQHRRAHAMQHRRRVDKSAGVEPRLSDPAVGERDRSRRNRRVGLQRLDPTVAGDMKPMRMAGAHRLQPVDVEGCDPGIDAMRGNIERLGKQALQLGRRKPLQRRKRRAIACQATEHGSDIGGMGLSDHRGVGEESADCSGPGHCRKRHVEAIPCRARRHCLARRRLLDEDPDQLGFVLVGRQQEVLRPQQAPTGLVILGQQSVAQHQVKQRVERLGGRRCKLIFQRFWRGGAQPGDVVEGQRRGLR